MPDVFQEAVGLNAKISETKDQFEVPTKVDKARPSSEEVASNKAKWGYTG